MTIQMLSTWNGLEEDGIYTLASAAEETRLIGLGLARDYRVGMDGSNPVFATNGAALSALVSKDEILSAANAGASSAWIPYQAGMRLAYALDSGSTSAQFSIDFSADGITSLGQAFTGTWASSSVAEITPPLYLTNPQAAFIRFNVISGGPLSVKRNV